MYIYIYIRMDGWIDWRGEGSEMGDKYIYYISLSYIHISEHKKLGMIMYDVFC